MSVVLVHGGNTKPKYYTLKKHFGLHENECIKFSLDIQCTIYVPDSG